MAAGRTVGLGGPPDAGLGGADPLACLGQSCTLHLAGRSANLPSGAAPAAVSLTPTATMIAQESPNSAASLRSSSATDEAVTSARRVPRTSELAVTSRTNFFGGPSEASAPLAPCALPNLSAGHAWTLNFGGSPLMEEIGTALFGFSTAIAMTCDATA
jgi:hypothetical protein